MAFKGRDPVRTKIVIIEQANSFNYLGSMLLMKKNWTLTTNCVTI
jgi:hypothetical protein